MDRSVVLLSGGLDSATALAIAKNAGFECFAISFDYGQRHRVELQLSAEQAKLQGVARHITIPIDLRAFGGSALTADIDVPKDRDEQEMKGEIPVTYVPARNTIFLSLALGWAETLGASDIFVGVNALDYSGYPDCRPEYIEAFQTLANLATKSGIVGEKQIRIHAPLVHDSKADIIRQGIALGVKYEFTSSCYDPEPSGKPCLRCDSCRLRLAGFATIGCRDPLLQRFQISIGEPDED